MSLTASISSSAWRPASPAAPPRSLEGPSPRGDFAATARDAAARLVSSALVLPILESLRDTPFLEGPFAPGHAERRFGPLLDMHLADRITTASGFGLVDAITHRLEARA